MLKYTALKYEDTNTRATVAITGSKSESNRALILQALSNGLIEIENLSEADDTTILKQRLAEIAGHNDVSTLLVDIGPAGTAMRFLTAFLAFKKGNYELTGSKRMLERPIQLLVEALKKLGAQIQYLGKEGFPPIQINGIEYPSTNSISINGNISSQYITALILIAPTLPGGLKLNVTNTITSRPYIDMTLSMLQDCGVTHTWDGDILNVNAQQFKKTKIYIEPDWSSASYWYSLVAISKVGEIFLPGFKKDSLQGDQEIVKIMAQLGVETSFEANGIRIFKSSVSSQNLSFDFINCPDLAQTVAVCCAILGKNAHFFGLETLKIKETNRVDALQKELIKINVKFEENNNMYILKSNNVVFPHTIAINTYEDHRMAMAFAPLAVKVNTLEIENLNVVNKSYPSFWADLSKVGIKIKQ